MVWWLWIFAGLALLVVETAVPGSLFALFFGLSAIGVGILVALGAGGPAWLQWLLFSILSVVALVALRHPLQARLSVGGRGTPVDSLVGEQAVVLEEVPVGGLGKVELRGAPWSGRTNDGPLAPGQRCRVERIEGLVLWVRPE